MPPGASVLNWVELATGATLSGCLRGRRRAPTRKRRSRRLAVPVTSRPRSPGFVGNLKRLRMERDILKNSRHLLGAAEIRIRCIEDHRDIWPVRVLCAALEVSASGYYAWRGRPESGRAAVNRDLLADVRRLHEQHRRRYGAPRIHAALRAEGRPVSRGRIERLMRRTASARRHAAAFGWSPPTEPWPAGRRQSPRSDLPRHPAE